MTKKTAEEILLEEQRRNEADRPALLEATRRLTLRRCMSCGHLRLFHQRGQACKSEGCTCPAFQETL
jgi:hypothetical protein